MKKSEELALIKKQELIRKIDEFRDKLVDGTSDADNFMSFSEIEQLWGNLKSDTNNIYSDIIKDVISDIDEKELIAKKKENTKKKE